MPEDIRAAEGAFEKAGFLLVQLEAPLATVQAALEMARKHDLTTILDPGPARPLPPEVLRLVDILTPNETEILTFADSAEPAAMALQLVRAGPRRVILKMGEAGVLVAPAPTDANGTSRYPAPRVKVVDTVAAGDCFNGALAVALAEERDFEDAVQFANLAAALSVTRPGAQASLPTREETERFRKNQVLRTEC